MKQEKYFFLLFAKNAFYRKGDIVLLENAGDRYIIVSDPNSRWRRLMRFLRINKSFAYKLKVL